MQRVTRQRGSTLLEFVLTGIPLIFIWLSIFWMTFGMWQFHTLQYASKIANSYAAVHGATYVQQASSFIHVSDVAKVFAGNAVGVVPKSVTLTLTAGAQSPYSCRLDNCETDSTQWPPSAANSVGTTIQVKAAYTLSSAIALWTPKNGATSFANSYNLSGYSYQEILF